MVAVSNAIKGGIQGIQQSYLAPLTLNLRRTCLNTYSKEKSNLACTLHNKLQAYINENNLLQTS